MNSIGRHDDETAFPLARQVARITRYQQRRNPHPGTLVLEEDRGRLLLVHWDQVRLPAIHLAVTVKNHWMIASWHCGDTPNTPKPSHYQRERAKPRTTSVRKPQ